MTNDSQQAIRAARAAINEAIDRCDSEGIAAFFLPTYHVVTARSMHRDGKEQSRRSWPLEVTGVYAAKWHFTADGWRLEAEIFTPLTIVRPERDAALINH